MEQLTKKHYTCKRLRLLEYLQDRGFIPTATIPDAKNSKYNWWLFEKSPELEKAVADYFETLKARGRANG
jgi:hypothetical protein